jgi:hypothetical protein
MADKTLNSKKMEEPSLTGAKRSREEEEEKSRILITQGIDLFSLIFTISTHIINLSRKEAANLDSYTNKRLTDYLSTKGSTLAGEMITKILMAVAEVGEPLSQDIMNILSETDSGREMVSKISTEYKKVVSEKSGLLPPEARKLFDDLMQADKKKD